MNLCGDNKIFITILAPSRLKEANAVYVHCMILSVFS